MTTTGTSPAAPAGIDPAIRRVPAMGGFNPTLLAIELRRTLRNRRTVVFALALPTAMYLIIAGTDTTWNDRIGPGNEAAYILISIALYGAALTSAAAGASVALERALGWNRQLRLTPLHPVAYIGTKALCALAVGGVSVAIVNAVGIVGGRADMPAGIWLASAVLALVCTLTFAALGVFVGYLVPGENVMQILGPGLAALSFLGGVFIPLTTGSAVWHVAVFTPMYGVAEIARSPLTHELPWYAVVNAVGWLAVFVGGAAWRMSKDTSRV